MKVRTVCIVALCLGVLSMAFQPLCAEVRICIDKNRMHLVVSDECHTDSGAVSIDTLGIFPISCGRGFGHKQRSGDLRTPEGTYRITQITDASGWGHDFHDGNGYIRHAYGPWFMRLSFGQGIGIHGTHDPASMGLRASEGCIRLRNEDLLKLKSMVRRGTQVQILADHTDSIAVPPIKLLEVSSVEFKHEIINTKHISYEKAIPPYGLSSDGRYHGIAHFLWWRRRG